MIFLNKIKLRVVNKKKSGIVVGDFMTYGIILLVTLMILQMFNAWATNFNRSRDIKNDAREYIEKMETTGYLTNQDKQNLIDKLTGHHMTNIDLTGTSFSPVGYGNEVSLIINGDVEVESVVQIGFAKLNKTTNTKHATIIRTSTAKY